MNKWQETVKRIAKQHPGKSLREILPIAKQEYKKIKHVSHPTKHHKKSRAHKRTRGRKVMRGGDGHSTSGTPVGEKSFNDTLEYATFPTESAHANTTQDIVSPDNTVQTSCQSGGSRCNTYKKPKRRRRPPTRRRRRNGKKKRN